MTNVLPFQMLSQFPEQIGFTCDGIGLVARAIWENRIAIVGLMAFGTVVKDWNDFQKIRSKWTCVCLLTQLTKRY